MKKLFTNFRLVLISVCFLLVFSTAKLYPGIIIPTDQNQQDFLKAYKLVLYSSYADYRFTNSHLDSTLFPKWGEYSVYWIMNGPNKGSFVIPDRLNPSYSSVTKSDYNIYSWKNTEHLAVQFKIYRFRIAIY